MYGFSAGERVVWVYQSERPKQKKYIAAEVIQPGRLRVRIRIQLAEGQTTLRWVKPENLRRNELERQLGGDWP